MMEPLSSRIISLWLLFILFIAFLTELGCSAGLIPADVLDAVATNSASWWREPFWLHATSAIVILIVLYFIAIVLFATDIPRRRGRVGGIAAVLLSSHLSPVYLVAPYIPLAGAIFSLLMAGGLLLQAKASVDPRALLRRFLPSEPADRILALVFGLLVLYCFLNQFREASKVFARSSDFGTFYDAAVALAGGNDPYGALSGRYFYPPTFAFCFRLLAWLPKVGASLLWFAIKMALDIWSLAAVNALFRGHTMPHARRRWFFVGMVFVSARFLIADLEYGNVNGLVLWLGLMAVILDFRGQSVLAGCALAAAISTKIVPALFLIYFGVRGRIRVLVWTVAWLVAINLFPFIFAAPLVARSWTAYFPLGVLGKLGNPLAQPDNQSLWGALNRFLDLPFSQVRLIWLVCSAFLVSIAAWIAFRARREDPALQAGAASLFFLLGLLVSPGSWVVHYGATLLPMAYLLREALASRSPVGVPAYLVWIVFTAATAAFTLSGWSRPTVRWSIEQSWFVAANCLVYFAIVFLNLRSIVFGADELPVMLSDSRSEGIR